MAQDPRMAQRCFILLDATLESQAPFFVQNPIFKTWLCSYNNVPELLQFISKIEIPYSIQIYMARDNILDDGLPSDTNGQMRTLLDTFCDLKTILHVTIFCPTINNDLEQQTRSIISSPRMIKDVISVVNLHSYMCKEGEQYFQDEINRCIHRNEIHLIENLQRNIDELMEYWKKVMGDRKKILETLAEEHSNKSGEEPS